MKTACVITVSTALAMLSPVTVGAQIRPLSPRPTGPTLQMPAAAPLQITEVPEGEIVVPAVFGIPASSDRILTVQTSGGQGQVTLTIESSGGPAGNNLRLVDPPAATALGPMVAVRSPVSPRAITATADPVRKRILMNGYGSMPPSVPMTHDVTVVARDRSGATVRRSFRIRYTKASAGPAQLQASATASQQTGTAVADLTEAQLDVTPTGRVPIVPFNQVTLRPSSSAINWHPYDVGSEIICVYGSFRYACDFALMDGANTIPSDLPRTVTVRVPDLGRGNSVGIILKNPYGESNMVMTTIDSRTRSLVRETRSFVGPNGGAQLFRVSPAARGMGLLTNGTGRPCDLPFLIWHDLKSDGRVYEGAAIGGVANVKFMGDASLRIVRVPRNQNITDNPEQSWSEVELTIPAGLAQAYIFDLEHSYDTRMGECPAKRR